MEKLHLLVATVVLCGVVQEALSARGGPSEGINLSEQRKRVIKNPKNGSDSGKPALPCFNNVFAIMQLFNVLKKYTDCGEVLEEAVKQYAEDLNSEALKYSKKADQSKITRGITTLTTQGKSMLEAYTTCLQDVEDAKKAEYANKIKGSIDSFNNVMANCEGKDRLSGHLAKLRKAL